MNLLAFDTSTDTLSIAVQRGDATWEHSGPGGAQASATLLPAIRALLADAGLSFDTLDAVVFGRGPGSFTGLRTACSVAQGLAFGARGGAGVPVLPIDTLLALAEAARQAQGCTRVVAVLDARMDEVYTARFELQGDGQWLGEGDFGLCAPQAVHVPPGYTVAGNARAAYGERLAPQALHVSALPTATALLRLAPSRLAAGKGQPASEALPLYVRDKVAQTTAERMAAKHAAAAAPTQPSPAP
ncbi:tRNA (adenosine(37)-N6)-threonylcarbamoyltransferase complex dimerization subunit type 1 TsaB [Acidovorax sp. SUPP3334]|uniref:tRNA (adenosine(37)-N6)-threonylcarbamoyltransferase complex dimerization subunit type 1 TsaB n=1 Tax=Acidovorax sp. SUPP3334 TaxID=2920881 RepID=UPI0023DE579F|nr:tRNA (adenosine(37)-N6)-threonylcarbamoyltransferase complex dimerization subunit type 1 TsaB [Acidovorax sp. SUPP3334]GKT23253.1 tRNA (adenosine(37)-N6)-threonylcarbamoyltransferase complex dimerization subunit type 1 TsaB [Acidovorax sp. SUPP3334]